MRDEPERGLLTPAPAAAELAACLESLRGALGDRLSTSDDVRAHHGRDESYHEPRRPDAVAFPRSTDEVRAVVEACGRHGIPLVPFGAGTSLEGAAIPVEGGVSLDTRHMDRVLRVSAEDMDCTVQAGVRRLALDRELRHTGLFFPVDPGADASLGGMAATAASGTTTVRYGTMRDHVLALEVVLADGRVVRTARRARKSAAGYDLTGLFVGSEGTLGVITELTLRLRAVPEAIVSATCAFPDADAAVRAVVAALRYGVPLARAELLDAATVDAVNRHAGLALPEAPTLFLELHGGPREVREQAEELRELAEAEGAVSFETAERPEERSRLWEARHEAYPAVLALRPGSRGLITDVCVPVSGLARCIRETREDVADASMPVALVGHVGDGNFHLIFAVDPDDPAEVEEARAFGRRLVGRALAADGTSTGEHGIGLGKREHLRQEHGEGAALMAELKHALDPGGILNPGKVVS